MNKCIPLLFFISILTLNACEKEKNEDVQTSSSFTAGGKKYEIIPAYDQCKYANLDCLKFNTSGNIEQSKSQGISLILFTEYANPNKTGLSLTINLYGEGVGKYKNISSFCNEFQIKNTSMIQSVDGSHVAILKDGSEVEITQKNKNTISGNFKLKVPYDNTFLNDSFIVGEFKNITLN